MRRLRPVLLASVAAFAAVVPVAHAADAPPTGTPTPDVTPPAKPVLTSARSGYVATANQVVTGTAEAGSVVQVFLESDCGTYSGAAPFATVSAEVLASTGVTVTLPPNAPVLLSSRATDDAGNQSDCASDPYFYYDPNVPSPPTVGLIGKTEDGAGLIFNAWASDGRRGNSLEVFTAPGCGGPPVTTAYVDKWGGSSFELRPTPTTATGLYVVHVNQAGTKSNCPVAPQATYTPPAPGVAGGAGAPGAGGSGGAGGSAFSGPAPLTAFVRAPRCIAASTAKARRPVLLTYAASAAVSLAFTLERSTTAKPLVACPKSVGPGKKPSFKPLLGGPLSGVTAVEASNGGRTGVGSIVPKKALAAGLYRLTTTATSADGRTSSVVDHLWVLRKR